MPSEESRSHTFIVRVWSEATPPGAGEVWRGTVIHVPSGARVAFGDFVALTTILDAFARGRTLS